jgi:hypothetical protein
MGNIVPKVVLSLSNRPEQPDPDEARKTQSEGISERED